MPKIIRGGVEYIGNDPALSDLRDVSISSPATSQVLTYNGSNWVNAAAPSGSSSLSGLSDVSISTPSNGDVLKYDSTADEWVNGQVSNVSSLDDLTNVTITTPTDGQILKYDGTSQEWINAAGGGSSADHITLTQAEYDALVQAGTVDPTAFYFISDGSPSAYEAKTLYYDDDYSSTSQTGTTIVLSESMEDFDMIAVRGGYIPSGNQLKDTGVQYILVSEIKRLIANYPDQTWVCTFFNHSQYGVSSVLKFNNLSEIYIHDIGIIGYQGVNNGRLVEVTGIKFSVVGGESHQYSTSEQVVGKWIDGSTLYEKTLIFNNKRVTCYEDTTGLEHGVTDIGSVKFVTEAYCDFNGGQDWATCMGSINQYTLGWKVGGSKIIMDHAEYSNLDFSASESRSYLFVIRYTKSSS